MGSPNKVKYLSPNAKPKSKLRQEMTTTSIKDFHFLSIKDKIYPMISQVSIDHKTLTQVAL